MTTAPYKTPLMPSRALICAIGWPEQLQYPQNNHVPLPALILQKSAVRVEGRVFLGFFYSFVSSQLKGGVEFSDESNFYFLCSNTQCIRYCNVANCCLGINS